MVDIAIGIEYKLALEILDIIGEAALVVHRRVRVQTICQSHFVVLAPMPRCGMHTTGASLQGDMLTQDDQ